MTLPGGGYQLTYRGLLFSDTLLDRVVTELENASLELETKTQAPQKLAQVEIT